MVGNKVLAAEAYSSRVEGTRQHVRDASGDLGLRTFAVA